MRFFGLILAVFMMPVTAQANCAKLPNFGPMVQYSNTIFTATTPPSLDDVARLNMLTRSVERLSLARRLRALDLFAHFSDSSFFLADSAIYIVKARRDGIEAAQAYAAKDAFQDRLARMHDMVAQTCPPTRMGSGILRDLSDLIMGQIMGQTRNADSITFTTGKALAPQNIETFLLVILVAATLPFIILMGPQPNSAWVGRMTRPSRQNMPSALDVNGLRLNTNITRIARKTLTFDMEYVDTWPTGTQADATIENICFSGVLSTARNGQLQLVLDNPLGRKKLADLKWRQKTAET